MSAIYRPERITLQTKYTEIAPKTSQHVRLKLHTSRTTPNSAHRAPSLVVNVFFVSNTTQLQVISIAINQPHVAANTPARPLKTSISPRRSRFVTLEGKKSANITPHVLKPLIHSYIHGKSLRTACSNPHISTPAVFSVLQSFPSSFPVLSG